MSASFVEESRPLPVLAEADVVVLGGGPGGIGAAVAAARNGAKTVLVERFGCFGGTWTSGILSAIMPFPFVKGIFAEITERLAKESAWLSHGREYGATGSYDSEGAKRVLDQIVVEAGITPLFFAQVAGVFRDGPRLRGIVIESKEGRHALAGKQFIDATGDGDVSVMAGAPWESGRQEDGARQPMTMIFKMDGADDARAEAYFQANPGCEKAWQAAKARGEVTVPREDVLYLRTPKAGQWAFNTTRIVGKDGTRLRDVTEATIEGRRQVAEVAAFLRNHIPGFEKATLTETAPHIGVRESRRIGCDYTMTTDDIMAPAAFDDAVARGNWFIDIHSPTGEGTVRIHPPEGKWYEIPYRSLRPRGLDNLLIASRCLGSTHEAHAAIRITPQIVAVGQGAGTAAALCVRRGLASTRDLDPALLRATLREQGAFI